MAGLNANEVVQITQFGSIGGQTTMSTYFYVISASSTSPSYTAAALNVATYWNSGVVNPGLAFTQAAPQNWTATKTRVQRVYPIRGVYVEYVNNLPGTIASDAEAYNVQGSIIRKTDAAGRTQVGALHSAPLPANAMADGLLTAAFQTLLGVVATRMKNTWTPTLETTSLVPILWSKTNPPIINKYITTTTVMTEIRTMRRRTVGLGI